VSVDTEQLIEELEYDDNGNVVGSRMVSYGPDNEQAVAALKKEEKEKEVPSWVARFRRGGDAILDEPEGLDAIWGDSDNALWVKGESLLVTGPSGIGKTTAVQRVVLASIGLGRSTVLDQPVTTCDRVLYLAMDRPRQIRRSFRRMVHDTDREVLNERLVLWDGPLPKYLPENPTLLLEMAQACGAQRVVVDSLKDVAYDLEKPETAARYNAARQHCLANEIELAEITHQRKRSAGNSKPKSLDDVFGGVWLGAGAGSVLLVWGAAGDPVVDISQLKYAAGDLGTMRALIDHRMGTVEIDQESRLEDLVGACGTGGATLDRLVRQAYPEATDDKTIQRSRAEKIRRRLNKLVKDGILETGDGKATVPGGTPPKVWKVVPGAAQAADGPEF